MKTYRVVLVVVIIFAIGCIVVFDGPSLNLQRMVDCSVRVVGGMSWGSGVFIGPNMILTAGHVGKDNPTTVFLNDGNQLQIKEIFISTEYDVAVLRVEIDHEFLSLGNKISLGEEVYLIGTPMSEDLFNCLFKGIISKLDADCDDWVDSFIADAWAMSGCSGGPIINKQGQIVGIFVGFIPGGDCSICEPISHIKETLKEFNL